MTTTVAIARAKRKPRGRTNTNGRTQERFVPAGQDRIVLYGIGWDTYEGLLADVGEQKIRMTYDQGTLEISVPLPVHERLSRVVHGLIVLMVLELDIPISSFGSTTFRRKRLRKGVEPDECYYVQSEPKVRGKMDLDLRRDPPPDLVVEIDITHPTVEKQPIYAALGVPEVWRFDGRRLTSLHRTAEGRYVARPRSLAFPFLRMTDLEKFLRMLPTSDEHTVMRAWRDWLRQRAKPGPGKSGERP